VRDWEEFNAGVEAAAELFWPAGRPKPDLRGLSGWALETQRDLLHGWIRGCAIRALKRHPEHGPELPADEAARWADDGGRC
jgi:hypothetical protein